MLPFAASVAIPVWLAPVLVGITALGQVVSVVGGIVNDMLAVRRLENADAQRAALEAARHKELLDAVNANKEIT